MEDPGMVDYLTQQDYRGFLFVVHEQYGLLLLYCSHKVKKGPHYQLPGGHVDRADFVKAGRLFPLGAPGSGVVENRSFLSDMTYTWRG